MQQQLVQDEATAATLETIKRFNEAFNRHDVDGIMELMTEDCVFENGMPAPDGQRLEGQAAVRGAWEQLFSTFHNAVFEEEELFAAADRSISRWTFRWEDKDGNPGHLRGVDIFQVRDGKVAVKLAYVKG
ncbi:MAG: nuclear transport factor 2 family protein [Dehalococcoidia bacterium]